MAVGIVTVPTMLVSVSDKPPKQKSKFKEICHSNSINVRNVYFLKDHIKVGRKGEG